MDSNNWRPNQGTEPTMDTSDWRAQLPPDSRQRIVNKIMDTLEKRLPVSGPEGLLELQKIAQRFEEKIFTAATSQPDYLQKISLKMLIMENKIQNTMANNMPSNQVGPSNKPQPQQSQPQAAQQQLMPQIHTQPTQLQQQLGLQQQPNPLQRDMQQKLQSSASLDSTAQAAQPSGRNWQEEVYQKIKTMEESYLPELNEMYQKIATKLQQHESLPQQPNSDQLEKLKVFKIMLERIISFLQVPKNKILPNFEEKLGSYEKQIINFINANRPRKGMSSMQLGQLPPPHLHSMPQSQSQVTQVQSHENQINSQLQPTNLQGSVAMQQNNIASFQHNSMSASLDSTAQTVQPSGGDWQEEVCQKIKTMKESYLPELNEMYQKIATKLQQHESLPQQPNSDQLEKLKVFKMMLERVITFLQVPKNEILPNFKEKLGSYEKQIRNFINANRPRKGLSSLQLGQLTPPHMHSMPQSQSQFTQVQYLENQVNSQLQPTNLQGSVAIMQQNNIASLQHNMEQKFTKHQV